MRNNNKMNDGEGHARSSADGQAAGGVASSSNQVIHHVIDYTI